MTTGPQTTLLAPAGDPEVDPYESDSGWLRAAQDQHKAEAGAFLAGEPFAAPARSHARTRRSWVPRRFRRKAPVPVVSALLADPRPMAAAGFLPEASGVSHDYDEPTHGHIDLGLTERGWRQAPEPAPAPEVAHEAPPAAGVPSWGPWDTQENREPLQAVLHVPSAHHWQLPVPAAESARRMTVLEYPAPADATRDRYAAVMRQVDACTGTRTVWGQPSAWSWLPAARSEEMANTWGWQREPLLALPAGSGEAP